MTNLFEPTKFPFHPRFTRLCSVDALSEQQNAKMNGEWRIHRPFLVGRTFMYIKGLVKYDKSFWAALSTHKMDFTEMHKYLKRLYFFELGNVLNNFL